MHLELNLRRSLTFSFFLVCFLPFSRANFSRSFVPWQGFSDEALLVRELVFNLTHPDVLHLTRPADDILKPTEVKVSVLVAKLISLDKTGLLLSVKVVMEWVDPRAVWNMTKYPGVTQVVMTKDLVWTPDFRLLNGVEESQKPVLFLFQDGLFQLSGKRLFHIPCSLDLDNFPYDRQSCSIELGSLQYQSSQINFLSFLEQGHIAFITAGADSQAWKFLPSKTKTLKTVVKRHARQYEFFEVSVHVQRANSFYHQFIVMPTIILSCLALTMFWLPISSDNRVSYSYNICICFILMMIAVFYVTPVLTTSKLVSFYAGNIIILSLSVLLSGVIVHVQHKETAMPSVLRSVFVKGLGTLLRATQSYSRVAPMPVFSLRKLYDSDDWYVMASVINRLNFLAYVGCLIYGIAVYIPYPVQ